MVVSDSVLHPCPTTLPSTNAHDIDKCLQRCVNDALRSMQQQPWFGSLFEPDGGKMFGVLLVEREGRVVYLLAHSGMLAGQWQHVGFVPPVFDLQRAAAILSAGESAIGKLNARLSQSDLSTQCQAAEKKLAEFDVQMQAELSELQHRLARRKRHRRLHRQRLQQQHSAVQSADSDGACKTGTTLPEVINGQPNEQLLTQLDRQSQADKKERKQQRKLWQTARLPLAQQWEKLNTARQRWQASTAEVSSQTQAALFDCYRLLNPSGRSMPLAALFADKQPPGGAGDCAAPKLMQYANAQGYRMLGLTEFWVGASPRSGVRRHGYQYPPCRAKCAPLIPWLSQGVRLCGVNTYQQSALYACTKDDIELQEIYDDQSMTVVNKPAGLLSTPGKSIKDSVFTRYAQLYTDATGPMLVHRLDMDTSGLMLLAKNATAHKALQAQFITRSVEKRYQALLDGDLNTDAGLVNLPLRVDLDDRPRQLVCETFGKAAQTRFHVVARESGVTRVVFEPLTGRTHQLRVHAAHARGLNAPIVGDPLYGRRDSRMMLHAESIAFKHPETGQKMSLTTPVPF